ncbi:MAG: PIN domain-containing protein [Flavobacteriales bacterium]
MPKKKNEYIETQDVFLDSSIFEEQNFMNSTKIHSLFYYAQEGAIRIHLTDISKMELFNRIEKRITESKKELKKLTQTFNHKNARIVKNVGFYETIKIPEIDIERHSLELKKKITTFFTKSNVNLIKTGNIAITKIVENYYDKKPPFHNSGKQNEFIDAIILASLETWCKRKKTKMYVLSKDRDFLGYKSNSLILHDNLSELLEKISSYYTRNYKTNQITSIRKIIDSNKADLELSSKSLIQEKVIIRSEKFDISGYEIENNKMDSYKIIAFRPDRTEVECLFKTNLSFYVFDIDDFTEKLAKKIHFEIKVPIYVEILKNGTLDIKWLVENTDYLYVE